MDNLRSLKARLNTKINAMLCSKNGSELGCLQESIAFSADLLGWLKMQSCYPQFYWRSRNPAQSDSEVIAALGEVRRFEDVRQANLFIQAQPFTLIGGLTFDGKGYFCLPRLLLQQHDNHLRLSLFWDNLQDWERERQALLQVLQGLESCAALSAPEYPIRPLAAKAEAQQWCSWVEKALQYIERGELNKVVLANQTAFVSSRPINPIDLLAESEKCNNGCYHFLFARSAHQAFLGSTPERLYLRRESHLYTEALAGTAAMSEDKEFNRQQGEWLLQDSKNDYENRLVVQDICDNLRPISRQIEVGEVSLKQLRRVQHLRRKISAELNPGYADEACLQAIHPTAAIAGLPRRKALDFLAATETFERGWYAGTLGFMNKSGAEFCVTIRSALIEGNKIAVFAGAGIVSGSEPEQEWREIERKASGLLSLLQKRGEQSCQ
ncbi:isochorismate synthase [Mesocricetibacter intestinalis]|uniref:Isochorismate synthase MenF n=1 Tax=Mesocricetibacter intestinalis TaxID=1521930 RepID=A0A4R6VBV8_9PAST|nr:isochorismate synthase [Mesocricetibacter intestinalis]TDQ58009.1 isochorismate synthase [Mesocricetibacter intestinalis]